MIRGWVATMRAPSLALQAWIGTTLSDWDMETQPVFRRKHYSIYEQSYTCFR